MADIPFKVSARAARLIGRENVATSQGAITELVKNAYDADAGACAVMFLPRYKQVPRSISGRQYQELSKFLQDAESYYEAVGQEYHLRTGLSGQFLDSVAAAFKDVLDLWIVDNGHGMSAQVIKDHWMVIGTDAKEIREHSVGGRVVTGAKGIGRFALDRLGYECELYSGEHEGAEIIHWSVDWECFEGRGKILDDVRASLDSYAEELCSLYQRIGIKEYLPKSVPVNETDYEPVSFLKGTAIRISHLHDVWDQRDSLKLKQTLEALLPPRERGGFNIYVYDYRDIASSGWIDSFPPDQFDYKMFAKINASGSVEFAIERKEIDPSKIRSAVFDYKEMQVDGFRRGDFLIGSYGYNKSIFNLRLTDNEKKDVLSIGPLDFTLYFFKLANPSADTLERYPQKSFDVAKRRRWLNSSGGIRIYRDGFRVRPYGEPNTQGSDWLLLGQRVASNPAAAKRIGWRVPPQQVAGTINITKHENPLLADQSNREGIMNERAFSVFRSLIISLIAEFEHDRSYIYRVFDRVYEAERADQKDIEEGKQLAEDALANADNPKPPQLELGVTNPESLHQANEELLSQNLKIAKAYKTEEQRNEVLKDEIQVMRGLATLGTVLVSFTHELKQIKANMDLRYRRMDNALKRVVDEERIKTVPEYVNPFNIVQRWAREDEKVGRWVDFALSAISPVKRRRKIIDFSSYLLNLSEYWEDFLKAKSIVLHIVDELEQPALLLAHEIDLDSIFYNLLINSVEAFIRPRDAESRDVWIKVASVSPNSIDVIYRDNGPGISEGFTSVSDIFSFGVSSKTTEGTEVSGTGIGMWLVKGIIDDYSGEVNLNSGIGESGFSISLKFPEYKKEG
ncbi:sensor histidine kinase [Pseudomonas sp. zfem003]|uniref:sensor histidine kinase n=1 Tax=Pseudomonas sp. zfem003 TaxID=3078198 RepID=UPI00292758AB|nr:sensor histidine kinase [Pseudomonas sp. zfem003]MDU9399378.1 sensor histidine kinase [Pseudomonas sp. zfem003]